MGAIIVGALLGAPPAGAVMYGVTGSLRISWRGDPARGCARTGQCGVTGTMFIDSGGGFTGQRLPIEVSDEAVVVHTSYTTPSGTTRRCTDVVSVDVEYGIRRSAGRLRAFVDRDNSLSAPAAGRCPGPLAGELARVMLPVRRVGRRGLDFSGRRTFGAGPFTVSETSTVRELVDPTATGGDTSVTVTGNGSSGGPPPLPHARNVTVEFVEAVYRITGVAGGWTTTFAGAGEPSCEPSASCGVTGLLAFTAPHISVSRVGFLAERIVHHPRGRRTALADLRSGRIPVLDDLGGDHMNGRVGATTHGADGSRCADFGEPTTFVVNSSIRRGVDRITVDTARFMLDFFVDPLRTHCEGPTNADVIGNGGLAVGRLPIAVIGDQHLSLPLAARGAFAGPGYRGARGGTVTVTLIRTRLTAGTRHEELYPGEPVP